MWATPIAPIHDRSPRPSAIHSDRPERSERPEAQRTPACGAFRSAAAGAPPAAPADPIFSKALRSPAPPRLLPTQAGRSRTQDPHVPSPAPPPGPIGAPAGRVRA